MFAALEQYDKTREWPIGRTRLDISLIIKFKYYSELYNQYGSNNYSNKQRTP